jgi:5-methyltetrahydrofolate corrinoid/iron sulfur protein methyltransferase
MIVVADNLRITLPAVQSALERLEPEPIRQMANACKAAGARAMDINSGPLTRNPAEKMTFLVRSVQACVDLPLVLDTTNPDAMAAGLVTCNGRATINGVSLEPEKLQRILPLAKQTDADLVAYLLRPDGHVPADAAGRMEAAVQLFAECEKAGISPERLIFDPIVAPLAWQDGNRQNMAVLETIRNLPDLLGEPVRTMAGLSNLTTGAPDAAARKRYQQAFLPMLAAAGTDFILMNALDPDLMRTVAACRNITAGNIFSWQ